MNDAAKKTSGGLSKAIDAMCGLIEQTYHYEKTCYDLSNKIIKNKAKIKEDLGRKDSLVVANSDGKEFMVSSKPDIDINFDIAKMQKTLDKDRFEKSTNKKVIIEDLPGLIGYLKKHGVSPKKFKEFISVEHEVDADKLDHLMDIEEISVTEAREFTDMTFEDVITIKKVK